jgi:hypothetical protein
MRLKREAMQAHLPNYAHLVCSTRAHLGLVLLSGVLLSGCSAEISKPDTQASQNFGCVDDSPGCISQRQGALRQLQTDAGRGWVRQPASINSYATGVRLFAFKTEKQRMTCDELAIGRREAAAAPNVLRSPQAMAIQPQIRNRSLMLADEVSKELGRESQRKQCRA